MVDIDYKKAIAEAKKTIEEQNELLEKLTRAPTLRATVISAEPRDKKGVVRALVSVDSRRYEVEIDRDVEVRPGTQVLCVAETMQVLGPARVGVGLGNIAHVVQRIDDARCEVEMGGNVFVVSSGLFSDRIEKGDRVVLDSDANQAVIDNLGRSGGQFESSADTGVHWGDIGGLEKAKAELIEAVEAPRTQSDLFKHYGKKPIKGVLLYGPPGCGKTMLGKAVATALARVHGKSGDKVGFFYVKATSILDRYVGVAEARVRQLFARAKAHEREHGYPGVIFLDEADAILGRRGSGVSSDMERTIVPAFLVEMSGIESSGAVTILATNRADTLDEAISRHDRIDRHVYVGRPDERASRDIFSLNLGRVPIAKGETVESLSGASAVELFDDARVIYLAKTEDSSGRRHERAITLSDVVNGAMISGIVEQAKSRAMRRDASEGTLGGVTRDDLVSAVDEVQDQVHGMSHSASIVDIVERAGERLVAISKVAAERRVASHVA